jgi:hypothetical protein
MLPAPCCAHGSAGILPAPCWHAGSKASLRLPDPDSRPLTPDPTFATRMSRRLPRNDRITGPILTDLESSPPPHPRLSGSGFRADWNLGVCEPTSRPTVLA